MTFSLGMPRVFPTDSCTCLRILRRSPQEDLAIAIVGKRNGRLHGGVREMRNVVIGFDHLAALGEFGVDIADVANHFARLVRGRL